MTIIFIGHVKCLVRTSSIYECDQTFSEIQKKLVTFQTCLYKETLKYFQSFYTMFFNFIDNHLKFCILPDWFQRKSDGSRPNAGIGTRTTRRIILLFSRWYSGYDQRRWYRSGTQHPLRMHQTLGEPWTAHFRYF